MSAESDKTRGDDGGAKVELHSRACSCGGGSWMIFGGASNAPCGKGSGTPTPGVVVAMDEWRSLGKPNSMEAYAERTNRAATGERREFKRYAVVLLAKLSRVRSWRDPSNQAEVTVTEVVAAGGALVRTRMAVEECEILVFEVAHYHTRAEVLYLTRASAPEGPYLRLGLRFLDERLPESLIPPGAKALE